MEKQKSVKSVICSRSREKVRYTMERIGECTFYCTRLGSMGNNSTVFCFVFSKLFLSPFLGFHFLVSNQHHLLGASLFSSSPFRGYGISTAPRQPCYFFFPLHTSVFSSNLSERLHSTLHFFRIVLGIDKKFKKRMVGGAGPERGANCGLASLHRFSRIRGFEPAGRLKRRGKGSTSRYTLLSYLSFLFACFFLCIY